VLAASGQLLPRQWRPPRPREPGPAGAAPARPPGPRVRPLVRRYFAPRWWRDHRLIAIAVALSLVPRILAALAFRPAQFTPDSFSYMAEGVHPGLSQWHPAGYPFFLWLLVPFHSLLLVTTVQHLMGIATALLVYAVLRRWDLPAWGATLAACPVLFDSRQIVLESSVLPDVLYGLLITAALAVLLTRRALTPARCAVAGLLMFGVAVVRGNGAPEMVAVLAVLLIQRAGWRAVTAAAAGFAIPLLAYMGTFAVRYGNFALTNSDGMFLWSRTMSFANCRVIRPPAGLRPLCPDRQPVPPHPAPAWSMTALLSARTPADYLWAPGVWWRRAAHPGFNSTNNALALRFALTAIRDQPGSYARTVASGVMLTFLATDRTLSVRALHFTPVPDVARLDAPQRRHLQEYGRLTSDTRAVQPWAYFVYLYQEPVYFPGLVFGLVLLAGLAGAVRSWRQRGGPAVLPWAVAALGVLVPVAVHEYHYRYAITIVPAACLAAGLAFARRAPAAAQEATPVPPLASIVPAQAQQTHSVAE
jgi:hypothetical protein